FGTSLEQNAAESLTRMRSYPFTATYRAFLTIPSRSGVIRRFQRVRLVRIRWRRRVRNQVRESTLPQTRMWRTTGILQATVRSLFDAFAAREPVSTSVENTSVGLRAGTGFRAGLCRQRRDGE